jgi:hypothetical protein
MGQVALTSTAPTFCIAKSTRPTTKRRTIVESITSLWLPIVVSSVAVFIASSIAWMALPHHKADIKFIPDEKTFLQQLGTLNLPPGLYMWPGCGGTPEAMKSPEYKQRFADGPWGLITIAGSKPNFARNLFWVFVVYSVVSVFVAYITAQARPAGSTFASVFQVAGATAVLGYCAGQVCGAVFMSKPFRFICTDLIDGLVYGLLTGAIFAWLWPAAATVAL